MAGIASTDVTYSVQSSSIDNQSRKSVIASIAFGDSALTYPSGGVALLKAKLGLPNSIQSLKIFDKGTSGYEFSYDSANEKLRMFQSATHTHSLFLNQADVVDGAGTRVNAATNLIGANSGSDISIAGVADTTGHGGVVNVAAGAMSELGTSVAPTALTIYVEATGY